MTGDISGPSLAPKGLFLRCSQQLPAHPRAVPSRARSDQYATELLKGPPGAVSGSLLRIDLPAESPPAASGWPPCPACAPHPVAPPEGGFLAPLGVLRPDRWASAWKSFQAATRDMAGFAFPHSSITLLHGLMARGFLCCALCGGCGRGQGSESRPCDCSWASGRWMSRLFRNYSPSEALPTPVGKALLVSVGTKIRCGT